MAVVDRLQRTMNAHDLEGFVACFAPDYDSAFPVHPARAVHGPEQVRRNWEHNFAEIPDMQAKVVRATEDGDTVWTEWEWTGTLSNGAAYLSRGVVILGIQGDQVAWARLYTEPVDEGALGRPAGGSTTA